MAQRRTNKSGTGGIDGVDVPLLAKKTKQILAAGAGMPEYANLTRRGRNYLEAVQSHTNQEALEKLLQELLLWQYFKEGGNVAGYTLENIPLGMRGKLKEVIWRYHTTWEGRKGAWSPALMDIYKKETSTMKKDRERWAYLQTLEDFDHSSGLLGMLAATSKETNDIRCDVNNPDFVRLLYMHDSDQITPVVSGRTGAGKTNFVLHTIRQAAFLHRGFVDPSGGRKASRIRAYLPNFDGHVKYQRRGAFPGVYSSFSYVYPWQVFVDEPKGSSILWTKYDWSMDQEQADDDSPDIFAIFYVGEAGLGKLKYPNSKEVMIYRNLFQLTRQMRIRYIMSSANPEPMPISLMIDFINPQIWLDVMPGSERRRAKAEYIISNGENTSTQDINLGSVPLDPLTKVIGRGIAADLTSQWEQFPFEKILVESRVTNMNIYLKEPDRAIEAASQLTLGFQDRYVENTSSEFDIDTTRQKREEEQQPKTKKIQQQDEDDDDSGIRM